MKKTNGRRKDKGIEERKDASGRREERRPEEETHDKWTENGRAGGRRTGRLEDESGRRR